MNAKGWVKRLERLLPKPSKFRSVVIEYDPDHEGRERAEQAAEQTTDKCAQQGIEAIIILLPFNGRGDSGRASARGVGPGANNESEV